MVDMTNDLQIFNKIFIEIHIPRRILSKPTLLPLDMIFLPHVFLRIGRRDVSI